MVENRNKWKSIKLADLISHCNQLSAVCQTFNIYRDKIDHVVRASIQPLCMLIQGKIVSKYLIKFFFFQKVPNKKVLPKNTEQNFFFSKEYQATFSFS